MSEIKTVKERVHLSEVSYSLRTSTAILQYGPGAMIDFPDQTLMAAAPEYWGAGMKVIHDRRLEKLLHVNKFCLPHNIGYVRFPRWYFCPKCRKFMPIEDWVRYYREKNYNKKDIDKDPNMVRHLRCPDCKQNLVVSRIIVACEEEGHIDDFPWVKWVHARNNQGQKPICDKPQLTIKTTASASEGLEGITIECKCGAKTSLQGAFNKNIFSKLDKKTNYQYDFSCTGFHPWKNERNSCVSDNLKKRYPRTLQRGGSSVYFPVVASSLVIPDYAEKAEEMIRKCFEFSQFQEEVERDSNVLFDDNKINQYCESINKRTGVENEVIQLLLKRITFQSNGTKEKETTRGNKYRAEEFEVLNGTMYLSGNNHDDFVRESTDMANYSIPYISQVSLIHKIREVNALLGFSRVTPLGEEENTDGQQKKYVSVKSSNDDWYPAYEGHGEGIFIEFDGHEIDAWIERNNKVINSRIKEMNDNYDASYFKRGFNVRVTPRFVLLHTISHLLIRQLSFECGYSIASLKERVYCGDDKDGIAMAGIFIYTSTGDSEGTLGGLVRQGRSDVFPSLFRKAMESSVVCSNDPVCNLSHGQGRESLNLSACHSCALLPETSCEINNVFLDRALISGTYEYPDVGFYSEQLFHNKPWKVEYKPHFISKKYITKAELIEEGQNLYDLSMDQIYELICDYVSNDEMSFFESLFHSDRIKGKEKPYLECSFAGNGSETNCLLYWKNSNVALFSAQQEPDYLILKDSNVKCFYADGQDTTILKVLDNLKEN